MGAMLTSWLDHIHQFGGPPVKRGGLSEPGESGSGRRSPAESVVTVPDEPARVPVPIPTWNGELIQLKELPITSSFELRTRTMDILMTLHGLRHENINPVLGCLMDPHHPALVLEWGSRGSLEDVLMADDIKLDWSFRLSLLTDLVRGMRYLHTTPIRVHGRLTSRNCVVDARWVLKVTDYGLPAFYSSQGITPPSRSARDLLWTAPELLRSDALRRRGTQPGDVFSFSIVMQEVVLRGEPYCLLQRKPEPERVSPDNIIVKLRNPPPLIRPSVSKGAAPPDAINIMRQCWDEHPERRPDFNEVHDQFKMLNDGKKVNIVDTMFQLLEKYSNNLEELVRERTEQLDMEKKKTEQLLNRMLPSQVVEKLKMGEPVEPEDYKEVTIYFSDIVGFTAISCHSTPAQVVDLLNDLYTCFDATINAFNVYKVETIGDAYMVVSGLPAPVADHADQIATMALHLLHQSGRFTIRHLPHTPLRLRIGLHTGPCCAGVVGLTMPRYCLFGDTVNTASRLESTGCAGRIHLSEATKKRLDEVNLYDIEYRGMTELKGKGVLPTYWLLGKKGFDKELPVPPPVGESHGLDESLLKSPPSPTNKDSVCPAPTSCVSAGARRKVFEAAVSRNTVFSHSVDLPTSRAPHTHRRSSLQLAAGSAHTGLCMLSMRPDATLCHTPSCEVPFLNPPHWCSSSSNLTGRDSTNLPRVVKNILLADRTDLSAGFNTYRCMNPKEPPVPRGSAVLARGLLRRQFSLDRGDFHGPSTSGLQKQNSAGAASDLQRIEEHPGPGPGAFGRRVHRSDSLSSGDSD